VSDELLEREALWTAYRSAKARHDAAITALKAASRGGVSPDPGLLEEQTAAAVQEFDALAAVKEAS
jgi:hypothetical protein